MIRNIRHSTNVSGASSTNHAAATSNIINIDERSARKTNCPIRRAALEIAFAQWIIAVSRLTTPFSDRRDTRGIYGFNRRAGKNLDFLENKIRFLGFLGFKGF